MNTSIETRQELVARVAAERHLSFADASRAIQQETLAKMGITPAQSAAPPPPPSSTSTLEAWNKLTLGQKHEAFAHWVNGG